MENVESYQQVSEVINRCEPTVVAIQELDSVTTRSNGVYVLDILAKNTNMVPTYAAAIDFQGGKYGIGLLSKEAPISVKRVPLPGREESRMLLVCEFKDFVMACTHLSLTKEDQILSINIIKESLKGYDKPVFLAGDMNSEPGSETQKGLNEFLSTLSSTAQPTFPANAPRECIDFIYTLDNKYSPAKVSDITVVSEAGTASDHLPVMLNVDIK
jgi:endonuclease/exonuclease/phosphatase family metal-dependent hydrolase